MSDTVSNMTPYFKLYTMIKSLRESLQDESLECTKHIEEIENLIKKHKEEIVELDKAALEYKQKRISINKFDNKLREIMNECNSGETTSYISPTGMGSDSSVTDPTKVEISLTGTTYCN